MNNALHLKDWTVQNVTNTADETRIDATYDVDAPGCVHCGSVHGVQRHGTRKQVLIDTPTHGKRSRVHVTRKRYRCRDCGRTFLQPLPDVADSGSMTKRAVEFIERQSLTHTFAHVAETVGVDEKTVRNVFNAYVDWLDQTVVFETPKVLGLDEVFLLGKARCVVTNIEARTIVGVLEDRNKPTLHHHLFWLAEKDNVTTVTMDMWRPYRDACRAILPHATIVVDKFHVVRMATQALETVRRGLRDAMTTSKRRQVMRSRFLLLKREWELSDDEKALVAEWTETLPTLGEAYRLKEGFYDVYRAKSRAEAEPLYDAWRESIPDGMKKPFHDLTRAVGNWREEVFAYFDRPYTNATTEALNGLSKIMNRNGRGYSFKAIRAKMLYNRHAQFTKARKAAAEDASDRMELLYMAPGEVDARDEHMSDLIERDRLPEHSYGTLLEHLDSMLAQQEYEAEHGA